MCQTSKLKTSICQTSKLKTSFYKDITTQVVKTHKRILLNGSSQDLFGVISAAKLRTYAEEVIQIFELFIVQLKRDAKIFFTHLKNGYINFCSINFSQKLVARTYNYIHFNSLKKDWQNFMKKCLPNLFIQYLFNLQKAICFGQISSCCMVCQII